MKPRSRFLILLAASALLAGCVISPSPQTMHPQPGQRALIVFKITHHDRAGESGTEIRKTGEIVTIQRGDAIIAGDDGDILRCPARELRPITREIAAVLAAQKQKAPDFIAAEELERWFPADKVPFTLHWLEPEEIAQVLRQSKP